MVSGNASMHSFHLLTQSISFGWCIKSFTFKVSINMYDPITIFLIVLDSFSVGRSFPYIVFYLEKFF